MLKVAWAPIYHHPLSENHRFPMAKYSLLPEQLIYEGTLETGDFFAPGLLSTERVLRSHEQSYWDKLDQLTLDPKAQRKIGFPLSQELVNRERTICQGTVDSVKFALQNGCSLNIAGGTHHAFSDRGEGFCLLNDIIIGAHELIDHHDITKILVIDLDVHQGNGTASMAREDSRIFTFSMHGEKNYPYHKEQSDLDVPLPDYIGDTDYLRILDHHLAKLFEKVEPEFVFYQSGVDILRGDKLGRMDISLAGCKQRDKLVLERCFINQVPIAINMGGGYSPEIKDIIEAHANTFRVAAFLHT
jgi:acetoin utilization deacetylase AcuC-like enzyme|tara:strand:- start:1359 stop:2261 length:903 start_codon:yes stop_codon:yes gene_type:complete